MTRYISGDQRGLNGNTDSRDRGAAGTAPESVSVVCKHGILRSWKCDTCDGAAQLPKAQPEAKNECDPGCCRLGHTDTCKHVEDSPPLASPLSREELEAAPETLALFVRQVARRPGKDILDAATFYHDRLVATARAGLDALADRERLEAECRALAKLAADTPQFFNPLAAFEAQAIRDKWLGGAQ